LVGRRAVGVLLGAAAARHCSRRTAGWRTRS
jgi:hypothetical protein